MGLDFIVIGAEEPGTAALAHRLSAHSDIAIPEDDRGPFFSREERYRRGVASGPGDPDSARSTGLVGEATSEYLCGKGDITAQVIAARIEAALPEVRLAFYLRDPVERARIAHAEASRRGDEARSFEQAVEELLGRRPLEEARWGEAEREAYIVNGEYGRILAAYFAIFDPARLSVHFCEEVERSAAAIGPILDFIGADPPRLPGAEPPAPPEFGGDHPDAMRAALARHFAADAELLTDLLGRRPPWLERPGSTQR